MFNHCHRPTVSYIVGVTSFLILSCLPLVAAFTRTPRTGPQHAAHWPTQHYLRRRCLLAVPPAGEAASCDSRRGFLDQCAAAVACGALVSASPANALSPSTASTANAKNSIQPNHSNPVNDPSSPTLAAAEYKPTAFQESISGFVSGSAVSTVKTLVKYPLDTATVRLQMPNTPFTILNLPALFSSSFEGIAAPLVSNIPAGALFFAVKDAVTSSLKEASPGLPKWARTGLAVGAALPPYWLLRNPSEVVKTRLQVGAPGYYDGMSTADAFRQALDGGGNSTSEGVGALYQGYSENVLYAYPADMIKFVAYDYLTGGRGKKNVSPVEGAAYGALSTALAQLVTTPLDVLRNRIMAEVASEDKDEAKKTPEDKSLDTDLSYIGMLTKIAKEEGVEQLFAGTTPRVLKAILSGAIQFATYEETKQKMSNFFIQRSGTQ